MNNDSNNQPLPDLGQAHQAQGQKISVSVPVGGVEGAPARVESTQNIESFVQSSEPEPQVSPEVSEYVQPTPRLKIKADASAAGVKESIPHGPNYTNLPNDQITAQNTAKTGDTTSSGTWRALLVIKEFARNLFNSGKQQQAH